MTPVQVVGVGGSGVLSGVVGLAQDAGDSFCVLLTSSGWTVGVTAMRASWATQR